MTNDNSIINLRNRAITWISIAVISLIGSWYIYGFFGSTSSPVFSQVEDLKTTLKLIQKE